MVDEEDPRAIRSVAVTTDDVVAAYEARQRSPRRPVLRVTPPFSGRMRARLHDPGPAARGSEAVGESGSEPVGDRDPSTGAIYLPPERLLDPDAIGAFPTPDDTEDALRADSEVEFTVERHRERHVEAVEEWRETVRGTLVDEVEIRVGEGGTHRVELKTLGDE